MTNKEAIQILRCSGYTSNPIEIDEAIELACKALEESEEQPTIEPCYQTTSCLDCKIYDKENYNCPRFCAVIKGLVDEKRPTGELEDFAKFVAREIFDDCFEFNLGAFAELACRRLVELGLVELQDGYYRMKGEEYD